MKKDDKETIGKHSGAHGRTEHSTPAFCDTDETVMANVRPDDDFFRQVNVEFLVHELKAPVSIIESGARLLLERQAPDAPLNALQQRTLERILRNTFKTRDMLSELLEVGRAQTACFNCCAFQPLPVLQQSIMTVIEAGDPALHDQMKDLARMEDRMAFLARHGIRLDFSPEAETKTMHQDQVKFTQIAGNLIQNSFQYRRRHLLIHAACRRNRFTVAVRDDGPGIAPAHHETIFQRYQQVFPDEGIARSGHGLGLAVARILARAMGGDIVVESELGQGALFHLHLPDTFPAENNP